MANCNNGKTFIDFLTTIAGGTAADATYLLSLTHYNCGNRKLCTSEVFPITSDLKFTPIGVPQSVGNDAYCCDVLCSGTVTYLPYVCGRSCCNVCPVTDNIYCTFCVPCSSTTVPTITAGTVVASPTNVQPCCNITNAVSLSVSFNVSTTTAGTDETSGGD